MSEKKQGGGVPKNCQSKIIEKVFEFSKKFFTESMKTNVELSRDNIDDILLSFSNIYSDITTIKSFPKYERNELCNNISQEIINIINSDNGSNQQRADILLQIESPVGSYRNKFLQLIFTCLCNNWCQDKKLPFYVNFAKYEIEKDSLKDSLEDDCSLIEKLIKEAKNNGISKFVFILDCIREFPCGMVDVYQKYVEKIDNFQTNNIICDVVVGVDTKFIFNVSNTEKKSDTDKKSTIDKQLADHRIAFLGNYGVDILNIEDVKKKVKNAVKISSMPVSKILECKKFIRNCIKVIGLLGSDDENQYYEALNNLQILRIDAYWLKVLIKSGNILIIDDNSITDIYERIVFSEMNNNDRKKMAQKAYSYEFDPNASYEDIRGQLFWSKIIMHRSIMDFLIAYNYVCLLTELYVSRVFQKEIPEFLNIVFPNSINKFILPYITNSEPLLNKLLSIAENKDMIERLSSNGLSQMSYWLGRITREGYKERCKKALASLLEFAYSKYFAVSLKNSHREINDKEENDMRNWLFAYRSAAVANLLFDEHKFTFTNANGELREIDYFKLLVKDKFLSDLNNGFHLEYYGDLYPKISNVGYQFNLKDNKKKGYNTFRMLAKALDCTEPYNYLKVSQLLTLCKLIQARKRSSRNTNPNIFDTTCYIDKCRGFINKFKSEAIFDGMNQFVKEYLNFMLNYVLTQEEEYGGYIETKKFNELMRANEIERTGWIKRRIPNSENIVEHMYNCWLMGFLFLPTTKKSLISVLNQKNLFNKKMENKYTGYNKNVILNMLLIHDLGETGKSGDVSQRDKEKKVKLKKHSKKVEDEIMTSLFLYGTYPFINTSFDEFYDYWDAWRTLEGKNLESAHINAKIAKDIDNIQTAYQYCYFFNKYKSIDQRKRTALIRQSTHRDKKLIDAKMSLEEVSFDKEDLYVWLNRLSDYSALSNIKTEIGKLICFMCIYKNPQFQNIVNLYNDNVDDQYNTFKKWRFDRYDTVVRTEICLTRKTDDE